MCHKNGMCPVTHADFPVPVISITASGPQAVGVCPHDTSVKQEINIFSGETEVHGDERLPQSHQGQLVVGRGETLIDFTMAKISQRSIEVSGKC